MEHKYAVVSGATKGIGLAIAKQLVVDGYTVLGTYVSNYSKDALEQLESEQFTLHQVDVSDHKQCLDFASSLNHPISVLVNNAGIVRDNIILGMSQSDFQAVVDTNLGGVFNMVKAFGKGMLRQRHGSIVNITSVIGEIGNSGQANYAASKAGVVGFSKSIAKEFGSRGVRVNCVAPGFIETDMTESLSDEMKHQIMNNTALKTLGQPEDIAHAVSFLVSDKARFITGQVLNVCGGLVI